MVTLFYEPSTRTKTSFEMAGKYLSADTSSLTVSASSVVKGIFDRYRSDHRSNGY